MNTKKKQKQMSYYIGTATMILCLFILPGLIPPWSELVQPEGVTVVFLFIGTIIGILTTNDCILSALFSMCALVFHGIFAPNEVIAAFLGNAMVWQVMTLFALSYVIVRDGTGETIARFILTRRVFQRRPLIIISVLMATMAVASIFLGVFGALIICFVLLKSICEEAGIEADSDFCRFLYLGCFISICVGTNVMGKMNALHWATAQFFIDGLGIDIPSYSFSLYSLYILVFFILLYILAMKFVFRCDMGKLANVDLVEILGTDNTKPTKRQALPLIGFLLIAVYTFFGGFLPGGIPLVAEIKGLGNIIFGVAVMAILALIRVDGERIFDLNEAFTKGINWPICLAIGSLATLGGQLLADQWGIKAWLVGALGSSLTTSSPLILLAVGIVVTTVLTNFFSNTATMYIMSALIASLSGPLMAAGYNVAVLPVAISTSAQLAYLTFASSGQATMLLSEKHMTNKFIWTKGIAVLGIWVVACFAVAGVLLMV